MECSKLQVDGAVADFCGGVLDEVFHTRFKVVSMRQNAMSLHDVGKVFEIEGYVLGISR